jgi:hypothetical protein
MSKITDIDYNAVTLERLKVAAQQRLSPQLAHDLKVETWEDLVLGQMVAQISTHVLAHRLLTDEQSATYSRTVTFEQPAPRWILIPHALLAVAVLVLGLVLGNLAMAAVAIPIVLVGVLADAKNPPRTHERTVSGTVTIPIDYYATFPENTMVYPDSLGRPYMLMQSASEDR